MLRTLSIAVALNAVAALGFRCVTQAQNRAAQNAPAFTPVL